MNQRCGSDETALRSGDGRQTDGAYPERNGEKYNVEDTDEVDDDFSSSSNFEDDLSSCSEEDNYKASTKVLLDRIEERWQR